MGFAVGGFVVSLAGVVGVNKFAYEHVVEKVGKYEVYKTHNSTMRLVSYAAVVGGKIGRAERGIGDLEEIFWGLMRL
jgi:hypothetical protein